jgi:hypothetical protein
MSSPLKSTGAISSARLANHAGAPAGLLPYEPHHKINS